MSALAYQADVDLWVPLERAPALFGTLDLAQPRQPVDVGRGANG